MKTTQIVTIKPRSVQEPAGVLEYQIIAPDGVTILSHGHQCAIPEAAGPATTLAEANAVVTADATAKGLLA